VVARPEWVVEVTGFEAVYLGPARLLVIARVHVADELRDAPAHEVARRLEEVRRELLQSPAIAEAVITVDREKW
jgi:hypothetical protein